MIQKPVRQALETTRQYVCTFWLLLTLLGVGVLSAAAEPPQETAMDSNVETTHPVRSFLTRYFEECLNAPGDLACLGDYWSKDGLDGTRDSEQIRRSAFPNLHYEVLGVFVADDHAAVFCRVTGQAARPSNATVGSDEPGTLEIEEAFFYRLHDGKIAKGKIFSDRLAVAQALGYTVERPGT